MRSAKDVYDFWFIEHSKEDWFAASETFDKEVYDGFASTHGAVTRGEGFVWRSTPKGRLAEIIVLDQFSRQLFRDKAKAFAYDSMALVLAQEAIGVGADKQLTEIERSFLYMPFMHSESLVIHAAGLRLFEQIGEEYAQFEHRHIEVLQRFGRYPKRNAALGRNSTPEELDYMQASAQRMF
ncbi:DUF924 family protein [Polycladidibacter hongkongensis]|uniref:DUF924 family protein n=1 Tax=Polycladidibacter hongkongensis TaxID=1647556 RepID=UPI00082E44B9|nr:DUF924 family protein [Pseudovibrio hongkongensis]